MAGTSGSWTAGGGGGGVAAVPSGSGSVVVTKPLCEDGRGEAASSSGGEAGDRSADAPAAAQNGSLEAHSANTAVGRAAAVVVPTSPHALSPFLQHVSAPNCAQVARPSPFHPAYGGIDADALRVHASRPSLSPPFPLSSISFPSCKAQRPLGRVAGTSRAVHISAVSTRRRFSRAVAGGGGEGGMAYDWADPSAGTVVGVGWGWAGEAESGETAEVAGKTAEVAVWPAATTGGGDGA